MFKPLPVHHTTTNDNITLSLSVLASDIINCSADKDEIGFQFDYIVDTWNSASFDGVNPVVRFMDWKWSDGGVTLLVTWTTTEDPTAIIFRSFVFSHLHDIGAKKSTDANDAYDRAMRGI